MHSRTQDSIGLSLASSKGSSNSGRHIVLVILAGSFAVGLSYAASMAALSVVGWLILFNAVLSVAPFAVAICRGKLDLFEPVYLFSVSFAVLFALRPAFDVTRGPGLPQYLGRSVSDGYAGALFIGTIGCLGFYLGYYSWLGGKLANSLPRLGNSWHTDTLVVATLAMLLMTAALFLLLIRDLGGFGGFLQFISGRSRTRSEFLDQSSGYVYSAPSWLRSLGILLFALGKGWRSPLSLLGLFLVCVSMITVLGAGNRSSFLPLILSVVILCYMKSDSRPRLSSVLLWATVGFSLFITLPREYRNVTSRENGLFATGWATFTNPGSSVRSFFEGLDTSMINGLALLYQSVPGMEPYRMGRTYVDDLARPIPSALWSGKPRSGDEQIMQITVADFYDRGVQIYSSLFAEPYFNFGIIGVIIFAFVFGLAWRMVFSWYRLDPGNPTVQALFAICWPFMFVYVRGGVGVDYPRQVISLMPAVILIVIAHRRQGVKGNSLPAKR